MRDLFDDNRQHPMRFFLKMVPPKTTHQSKKINTHGKFARLADSKKLTDAKDTYESMILPHVPDTPIQGPIAMSLVFIWPYPAGVSKKIQATGELVTKATKPDCSNIAKTLEDRLAVMRVIENDQCVYDLRVRKFYGPADRVGIEIEIYGAVE